MNKVKTNVNNLKGKVKDIEKRLMFLKMRLNELLLTIQSVCPHVKLLTSHGQT